MSAGPRCHCRTQHTHRQIILTYQITATEVAVSPKRGVKKSSVPEIRPRFFQDAAKADGADLQRQAGFYAVGLHRDAA